MRMRYGDFMQNHCTWHKVRVCTGEAFHEILSGSLGALNLNNFPSVKSADRKLFYRRPSYWECAVVSRTKKPTGEKILCFQNIQESRSARYRMSHVVAFPCVTYIHSSQSSAIDKRRMTFSRGIHRSHVARRTLRD
jgi:hypothetical protein